MSLDFRRVAIVAIALAGVGAVVGGILGGLLVTVMTLPLGFFTEAVPTGATFGAMVGVVLAPIAAFTLMRRVPLWRAIGETAAGTVVGAGLGMGLEPLYHSFFLSAIPLGVAGFVLAAARLRFASPYRLPSAQHKELHD